MFQKKSHGSKWLAAGNASLQPGVPMLDFPFFAEYSPQYDYKALPRHILGRGLYDADQRPVV
jgi:hypothetical protein